MRRQRVHVAKHGHDDLQVPDWSKDNAAGRRILEHNGAPVFEVPGFRLEGGSIHTDGQGTLIATEQCLLHPSRNPDLGRPGIEAASPACVPSSFPASGSLSMCHAAVSRPLSVVRPLAPGIAARCAHSAAILSLAAQQHGSSMITLVHFDSDHVSATPSLVVSLHVSTTTTCPNLTPPRQTLQAIQAGWTTRAAHGGRC